MRSFWHNHFLRWNPLAIAIAVAIAVIVAVAVAVAADYIFALPSRSIYLSIFTEESNCLRKGTDALVYGNELHI